MNTLMSGRRMAPTTVAGTALAPAPQRPANKLMIWDGSHTLKRAHHGHVRRLINGDGDDITAVWGALQIMGADAQRFGPSHMVAVFDGPNNKGSRLAIDMHYKCGRMAQADAAMGTPLDTVQAREWLISVLQAFGVTCLSVPDVEADDVIFTLVTCLSPQAKIKMMLRDKDMMGLVRPGVTAYDGVTKVTFNRAQVIARYGVAPDQMTDYLCLTGDDVDSVAGCPGIGPKYAAAILGHSPSVLDFVNGLVPTDKQLARLYHKVRAWVTDPKGYAHTHSLIQLQYVSAVGDNLTLADTAIGACDPQIVRPILQRLGIRVLHDWFRYRLTGARGRPSMWSST